MFRKLLIANRGEIAVRVINTARSLQIPTVAVFSEADRDAMHVRLADESACIGPAPAVHSYLDIQAIVAAARSRGVDAIHPGYGFLSENATFAEAVTAAGITFIGPPASVMATMGNKLEARKAAIAAGLPVLAGSEQSIDTPDDARETAQRIGFPLFVKANHGGGGRGMRVVHDMASLDRAIESARREAAAAFGQGDVFIERCLEAPRHVEIQVLGDRHGQIVYLGDRDCSLQRRHQKLLEEAPAPDIPDELRRAMYEAAVSLARSVGYVGAGTVEFLVDRERRSFTFLEMNTRLQVEHGVTEMICGLDIVELQIRIASGERLSFSQSDLTFHGHAIEARILAEDPRNGFRPDSGRIDELELPRDSSIRYDFGVEAGDDVQPFYDSMIGKVIAWAPDRNAAIERLRRSLESTRTVGIVTSARYLAGILSEPDFLACRHHTGSVEQAGAPAADTPEAGPMERDRDREEFMKATCEITERRIRLPGPPTRTIAVFGRSDHAELRAGPSPRSDAAEDPDSAAATGNALGDGAVTAPMDGLLVEWRVQSGQAVAKGEALAVLEAMKMEVILPSPHKGIVTAQPIAAGSAVAKGQVVATIEHPDERLKS